MGEIERTSEDGSGLKTGAPGLGGLHLPLQFSKLQNWDLGAILTKIQIAFSQIIIQCVHGSTAIVRHMVSPLDDDISKIRMILWNQHICGFILVYVMPGYSQDYCEKT